MNAPILAALMLIQASGTQPIPTTSISQRQFDPVGSCEDGGRSFDLHRVMFLENRSVDIDGPDGPLRVSVHRDIVNIENLGERSDRSIYFNNIATEVDSGGNLDLELKLAFFDGRLVLYWKETYQNRFYRQGLFGIVGQGIISLCEGQGGINIIH